jgi:hypothetical protein
MATNENKCIVPDNMIVVLKAIFFDFVNSDYGKHVDVMPERFGCDKNYTNWTSERTTKKNILGCTWTNHIDEKVYMLTRESLGQLEKHQRNLAIKAQKELCKTLLPNNPHL